MIPKRLIHHLLRRRQTVRLNSGNLRPTTTTKTFATATTTTTTNTTRATINIHTAFPHHNSRRPLPSARPISFEEELRVRVRGRGSCRGINTTTLLPLDISRGVESGDTSTSTSASSMTPPQPPPSATESHTAEAIIMTETGEVNVIGKEGDGVIVKVELEKLAIEDTTATTATETKEEEVTGTIKDVETTTARLIKTYTPRYIDVGINLADEVYAGMYYGKQQHPDDHADVVERALSVGVKKMLVTGSCMESSRKAIELAEKFPGIIYATVGIHPCQASAFDDPANGGPEKLLKELEELVVEGKRKGAVMAFGEVGLDYDRLNHCPADAQITHFTSQLHLALRLHLPLFLHSRAASHDFERLLAPHIPSLPGCLVHSFTGTHEELQRLLALGVYIGVNGCSLKTEENLSVVKEIPLDRLMLETDGPWCEVRRSSAGYKYLVESDDAQAKAQTEAQEEVVWLGGEEDVVRLKKEEEVEEGAKTVVVKLGGPPPIQRGKGKPRKKDRWLKGFMVTGRNEPVTIEQVAWIVARVKGVSVEEVCEAAWRNTVKVFGLEATLDAE